MLASLRPSDLDFVRSLGRASSVALTVEQDSNRVPTPPFAFSSTMAPFSAEPTISDSDPIEAEFSTPEDPAAELARLRQELREREIELRVLRQAEHLTTARLAALGLSGPPPTMPGASAPAPGAAAAAPVQPPAQRRNVTAEPEPFGGDRNKGRQFYQQCWVYMRARPTDFPTDEDRMLFILSWMKTGPAAVWAGTITQKLMEGRTPFASFSDFIAEFKSRFTLTDEAGNAANRLETLEQGARAVDDYATEFLALSDLSGYGEVELQRKFKRGLNPGLLDKVYNLPQPPADLSGLISEASRLEQQWRERQTFRKTTSGVRTGGTSGQTPRAATAVASPATPAPTPARREPDVKPMDVDRTRAAGPGARKRTCYDCGQEGHFRGDPRCPVHVRTMTEIVRTVAAEFLSGSGAKAEPADGTAAPKTPSASDGVFDEAHE